MLFQLEWKYLKSTVPRVGSMMGHIYDSLREAFLLAIFVGEEVSANLREILGHSVKHGGQGIPYPRLLADCVYNTSKASSEFLLGSLQGGTDLNYVARKGCVRTETLVVFVEGVVDETEEAVRRGGTESPPVGNR